MHFDWIVDLTKRLVITQIFEEVFVKTKKPLLPIILPVPLSITQFLSIRHSNKIISLAHKKFCFINPFYFSALSFSSMALD